MGPDTNIDIVGQLSELRSLVLQLMEKIESPVATRESYSVEEAAKILDREPYTVREWCRLGRINAAKRAEQRGGYAVWSISAAELTRIKDDGLLPPNSDRNMRTRG